MNKAARNLEVEDGRKAQLVYAFQRIFRALAPILVRAGVPYYEFRDILRMEYIAAALRDGVPGWLPSGEPSIAELSLALGIPEAEVRNLVEHPERLSPPTETNMDLITAVCTVWSTDTLYLGPYGMPLQLPLKETKGPNFTDLVQKLKPGADARALMEEMLKLGAISRVGPAHVRMENRNVQIPSSEKGKLYERLGGELEHLADTITHNIFAEAGKKRLHTQVFSDSPIPVSKLEEFDKLVRGLYMDTFVQIDDWFVKTAAEAAGSAEEKVVLGVVVHQFQRREHEDPIPYEDFLLKDPAPHRRSPWILDSKALSEES